MANADAAAHGELNERVEYSMWTVHRRHWESTATAANVDAARSALAELVAGGGTDRGSYRVAGLRADADWMFWWHAPSLTLLQDTYERVAAALTRVSKPAWSIVGLHRPAEFNREHIPAYLRGAAPKRYLAVYPFDRSYEWYLLPSAERSQLLAEHGAAARAFPDVLSNTVATFGLSDHEWVLALEADEACRLVDLMRQFRATGARHHVRVETPFYTGERVPLDLLLELPGGTPSHASTTNWTGRPA